MKKCVLFITGAIVSLMLIITACEEISDNKNNDPVIEESSDYIWDETKAIQVSLNGNSSRILLPEVSGNDYHSSEPYERSILTGKL